MAGFADHIRVVRILFGHDEDVPEFSKVEGGCGGVVFMFMLDPADAVPPAPSFTWTVKENDPATVGTPEIIPVEGDKSRPLGSCPLNNNQVLGGVPPAACSDVL